MGPLTSGSGQRERAAWHESGHAVMALLHAVELGVVSVDPDGRNGSCEHGPAPSDLALAMVRAAGPAAEAEAMGEYRRTGSREDLKALRELAGRELPDADPFAVATWWISTARRRLATEAWNPVRALSQELVVRTELSGAEARDIARRAGLALEEPASGPRVVRYPTSRPPDLEALVALASLERSFPLRLFNDGRGLRSPGIPRTWARSA